MGFYVSLGSWHSLALPARGMAYPRSYTRHSSVTPMTATFMHSFGATPMLPLH